MTRAATKAGKRRMAGVSVTPTEEVDLVAEAVGASPTRKGKRPKFRRAMFSMSQEMLAALGDEAWRAAKARGTRKPDAGEPVREAVELWLQKNAGTEWWDRSSKGR